MSAVEAAADALRERRPAADGPPRIAPVTPDAARLTARVAAAPRGPGVTPNLNYPESPR
jgi:hypothetical protein